MHDHISQVPASVWLPWCAGPTTDSVQCWGPAKRWSSPCTKWGCSVLWVHLVRQLAGMTEHDGADLRGSAGLNLLQHAEHKHSRLPHAGLGLAQHVHAQDGLRDALVLHCEQQTTRRPSVNTTRPRLRMKNAEVCYSHVARLLVCWHYDIKWFRTQPAFPGSNC